MLKYNIIVTANAEFNGEVEAGTLGEAIEIAKDAAIQRRCLSVKVERVILLTPEEPVLPLRKLPTETL